jgi:hypothetical protein
MRPLLIGAVATASLLGASLAFSGAEAAPAAQLESGVYFAGDAPALQPAQFFFGGQNYCWYAGGWRGPGYYWCGYAWRRGFGWGGGAGWNGWRGGGRGGGYGHGGGYGRGGGYGGGHVTAGFVGGGVSHSSGRSGGGHAGGSHAGGGHAGGGHSGRQH